MGKHNYFTGSLSFLDYDDFALYNVIDDISYDKISTDWLKALVGCQKDVIVKGKYLKDFRIKGGIPSIILCNDDMDWLPKMKDSLRIWFDSNCTTHYMYDSTPFF